MTILKKQHGFTGKYSALPSPIDKRDYVASFVFTDNVILPDEYITPNLIPIYNQGEIGSCVAHASSSMFEYLNQLHNNKYQEFSKGFIYAHKDDITTSGMIPRNAIKFLCNNGDVLYSDFPYNLEVPDIVTQYNQSGGDDKFLPLANQHKEMLAYFQLNDDTSIKAAIYKYGYVIVEIPIREDTQVIYQLINENPKTHECEDYEAEFEEGNGNIKGYHMIALCGWSTKRNAFYFANSWNTDWGKDGFAWLPYTYTRVETWGSSGYVTVKHDTPSPIPQPVPIIKKKPDNEIVQIFWKIINWLINVFKRK